MAISLLYPCSPLNPRQVDELYADEYSCARRAGLSVHCFDIENIARSPISCQVEEGKRIIYRGYMLNEKAYSELERRFGEQLLVSKHKYLSAHHFPHWYKEIEPLTIPSIISTEEFAQKDFKKMHSKAFIKDFVKSLKTGKGSIVEGDDDLVRAMNDLKHYRGVIEGGIVLRQVVHFEPNSEMRFFIVDNRIFTPRESICTELYALVEKVVERLSHKKLKFYSVDLARTQKGAYMVVEIGDGQVSDYVGWSVERFISVLRHLSTI